MRENRVKRILREGGLALGTHVGGIADPQIVEIEALIVPTFIGLGHEIPLGVGPDHDLFRIRVPFD